MLLKNTKIGLFWGFFFPPSAALRFLQQYLTLTVTHMESLKMLRFSWYGGVNASIFFHVPCSLRRGLRGFTGKQKWQTKKSFSKRLSAGL